MKNKWPNKIIQRVYTCSRCGETRTIQEIAGEMPRSWIHGCRPKWLFWQKKGEFQPPPLDNVCWAVKDILKSFPLPGNPNKTKNSDTKG